MERDVSTRPTAALKPFNLLLLRSGKTVLGYVNRCAHFGVPLAASIQQLILRPRVSISCNVHYARYRWHDGTCESGECAGESLITVPVEVVGGRVQIGAGSGLLAEATQQRGDRT